MSKSRTDRVLIASNSDEDSPVKNSPSVAQRRRKHADKTTPMQIVTRSKSGKLKEQPESETRSFFEDVYQKISGKDKTNPIKDNNGQPVTISGKGRKDSKQSISSSNESTSIRPLHDANSTPHERDLNKAQNLESITPESKISAPPRLARKKSTKDKSSTDLSPGALSSYDLHSTTDDRDVEVFQDDGSITSESRRTTRRGLARKNYEAVATRNDTGAKVPVDSASVYSLADNQSQTLKFQDVKTPEGEARGMDESLKTSCRRNQSSKEILKTSKYHDMVQLLDDVPLVRSPTPPRVRLLHSRTKSKSVSKIMSGALKALDQVKARLEKKTPPQRKTCGVDSDVELLYEENRSCIQVKVRYLSTVHRIEMKASEPFHTLTTRLAEITGEDEKTVCLYLRDSCLSLSENPLTVDLTVADIIECYCIKPEADQVTSSSHINLVIRNIKTKTRTTISSNIRNPLKEVMDSYAAMTNLQSSSLTFTFDGEELDPLDTPLKLELEDGDCLDVN